MTEFKEQWERMTVVERIAYIRADWAKCGYTDDPMVLRIAAAVAHDVCRQAADEIERLRADRDEARRMWCEAEHLGNSISADAMDRRARAEAKRRGWDCFERDAK